MEAQRLHTKRPVIIYSRVSNLITSIRFLDINIAQDSHKCKERPVIRILLPDTFALAVTEALLHARWQSVVFLADHALRFERVGVLEDIRVAVDLRQNGDDGLVGWDFVLAVTQRDRALGIGDRFDVETGRHGGKTEGFAEDGLTVGELGEVFIFPFTRADDGVDLLLRLFNFLWVLDEVVQREGDEIGGCGGADENVDDFVEDLAVCQGVAGLRVFAVEHGVEHVLFGVLAILARGDDLGAVVAHDLDVVVELAVVVQPVEEAGSCGTAHGFAGRGFLGFNNSRLLAQDAVDALVEEAQHVGGVVETVQIVGHADLLVVARRPFLDQILCCVAHACEFLADGLWADQRCHDAMCLAPAVIFGVEGCEETVVDGCADLDDGSCHAFPEASLVADFFDVGVVGDEDNLMAEDIDFEDGACSLALYQKIVISIASSPYFSASAFKDPQVLEGLTSKMLPRIGRPGGAGIGAGMMDNSNHRKMMQHRARREEQEEKSKPNHL